LSRKQSVRTSPSPLVNPGLKSHLVRLVVAVLVAALAFLFVIGPPHFASTFLMRGIFAGLSAGLLFSKREWYYGAATATVGALLSSASIFVPGVMPPAVIAGAVLVIPGLLGALVAKFLPRESQWPAMLLVALALSLTFAWSSGVLGGPMRTPLDQTRDRVSRVPQPEQYESDPFIYIRTVDLMRTGVPYYSAFQSAWSDDSRLEGTIPSALNFREPLLFEFWKYLPGSPAGTSILNSYLVLAWASVLLCWLTARRFVADGVAMLAGQLIIPIYAGFAFVGLWFTMAEIWSSVLVLGGLCLLVRGKYLPSVVLIVCAVAVRELAAVYVPAWALAWYFGGERRRWLSGLLLALTGPLVVLGSHIASAPALQSGSAPSLRNWMHSSGVPSALEAIRFGGMSPWARLILPLAAVSSWIGSISIQEPWLRWTLLYVAVAPLAFLTAFSSGEFAYYWGLMFQPTLIAFASLVFVRVFPAGE